MHQIRKFSILTKMQLGNELPATPSEADGSHHLECSFPSTPVTPEITERYRPGREDEWKVRHGAELHLAASYWWFGQCSSAHLRKITGRSSLMTHLYPSRCRFTSISWASRSQYDSDLGKKKEDIGEGCHKAQATCRSQNNWSARRERLYCTNCPIK